MTSIRLITALLLVFLRIETFSQKAQYNYETDFCTCTGTFDSTKYSRTQLENTLNLLWNTEPIHTDATARTLNKANEPDLGSLISECNNRLHELNSVKFINNKFWTKIKEDRIAEIESTCRLREYTILAWNNPDTLLSYNVVDSTCIYYRDALIDGGEEMIQAWICLNERMKRNNGDPGKVQRKFDEKFTSINRLDYARLDLMTYGWWNSANHLILHVNAGGDFESEFKKLFTKVKCNCDEP